jgi:hypothetical protein
MPEREPPPDPELVGEAVKVAALIEMVQAFPQTEVAAMVPDFAVTVSGCAR